MKNKFRHFSDSDLMHIAASFETSIIGARKASHNTHLERIEPLQVEINKELSDRLNKNRNEDQKELRFNC